MKWWSKILAICSLCQTASAMHNYSFAGKVSVSSNNTIIVKKNNSENDPGSLAKEQQRLIDDLLQNYDNNVRPVEDPSENLSVRIVPSVRQIVEMYWYDKSLAWNRSNYSSISQFNVEATKIWVPDLSLLNGAQKGQDALIYTKMKTKVIVHSDGKCLWLSPYFSSTACTIDSTLFPFDEQTCEIEIGSWTATGLTIDVNLGENVTMDTSSYLENIQWKLQSVAARKRTKIYRTSPAPYPSVIFKFVLRRRSLFFIINLIFPCIVLSFLSLLTFSIPPASGERVTLSISLLLTMLFTLYIVTENLPPDSTTVPLLTKFIGVAMLIMTSSLFATSVAIKFESKTQPVPTWLNLIVGKYLGYLVLHNTSWLRKCSTQRRRKNENKSLGGHSPDENQECLLQRKAEERLQSQNAPNNCKHHSPHSSRNSLDQQLSSGTKTAAVAKTASLKTSSIAQKLRCLSNQVERKKTEEARKEEWKEIGKILNSFFQTLFFAVLFFSTVAIFNGTRYTA